MGDTRSDQKALTEYLPDLDRAAGPWNQMWRDLVAPVPRSEWARQVTAVVIHQYTEIRAFVTRGLLLTALIVLIAQMGPLTWVAWLLLSIGVVQTTLEIYLDFKLMAFEQRQDEPDLAIVRMVVHHLADTQWERTLLNLTGILGGLAVVGNLVCVLYLTGPDSGWMKVLALAIAVLYGNSGVLAVLTDATFYSHNQTFSPRSPIAVLRAHAWFIGMVILCLLLAGSVLMGRWDPAMLPLAVAVAVMLPWAIGMKMRDYDRFLRASSQVAEEAMNEARARLAHDIHDITNSLRTHKRAIDDGREATPLTMINYIDLTNSLNLASEMADEKAWLKADKTITVEGAVNRMRADYSLQVESDIDLGLVNKDNYQQARRLISTALVNVGHALNRQEHPDRSVSVSAKVREEMIEVVVADPLPLIPESVWCAENTTLGKVRDLLRDCGGDLVQVASGEGKKIIGMWPLMRPPIRQGN